MTREIKTKANKTSFKKGHKKSGGINKGDKMSNKAKEKIRQSLLGKTGTLSRNWKGGTTSLRKLLPSLSIYKTWRRSVFERDDYTCQFCGVRGVYLEADHIIPLRVLIKKYSIKTSNDALSCIELWNIDNGRTLCNPCHRTTDSFAQRAIQNYE